MIYSEISRVLGRYLMYLSGILLIPLGVAILYDFYFDEKIYFKTPATFAFLETLAICVILSALFRTLGKKSTGRLHRKESILLVAIIWFLTATIGALPFIQTNVFSNPVDAYFESMSGLTTTGCSIIQPKAYDSDGQEIPVTFENPLDPAIKYTFYGTVAPLKDPDTGVILKEGLEALGKPLLFWRCFLQWLGGMGIVVLFIAVLPALAMGGKFLYESEVPGPNKEGMMPRVTETAGFLWKIYLGLTVAQIILMLTSDPTMSLFDATSLSFSTISTGGFTVRNDGLASYHNISWAIGLFMILGSLNFSLYFFCLRGKFYRLYEPEFFYYLITLVFGCLLMTWNLWRVHFPFSEALGQGSFLAISAQTSTGFAIANYDLWPFTCQMLLIVLMYIGGMSGSTAGGIKIIRYVIVLRILKNKIESLFRPEAVRVLKVGEREIPDKTAMTVLTFFCIVISLSIIGTYFLVLDGSDPFTAIGIISTSMNNGGLTFGGIGSTGSLAFLSNFSKTVSILWMALGRLEYFSLLVLLVPAFWRRR